MTVVKPYIRLDHPDLEHRETPKPISEYTLRDRPPSGWGFLYKVTSPSGKVYVGQTRRAVGARFSEHVRYKKANYLLCRAVEKYGAAAMKVELLGCYFMELLDFAEKLAISEYGSVTPGGYNIACGGSDYNPREPKSEETRRKLAEASRGHTLSAESRKRISDGNRGKKLSDETKARISAAGMGRRQSAESIAKRTASRAGFKQSPEAIAKMVATKRGQKQKPETVARRAASNRGKKRSAEFCAAQAARMRNRTVSAETRARMSLVTRARGKQSEAACANKREAQQLRRAVEAASKLHAILNAAYEKDLLFCLT